MELHERIKCLRNTLGLTMEKFGERLGVKKNTVSQWESGISNLGEHIIISILNMNWNGQYVNPEWLRNGEDNDKMFLPTNRNLDIARLTKQLLDEESDSFKNRLISMLSNLSEEEWEFLENKAKELVDGRT